MWHINKEITYECGNHFRCKSSFNDKKNKNKHWKTSRDARGAEMAHELQDSWILGYKTNASSVEVAHSWSERNTDMQHYIYGIQSAHVSTKIMKAKSRYDKNPIFLFFN